MPFLQPLPLPACLQGSSRAVRYLAFFSACSCTAQPVTAGRRLLLQYSIAWTGPQQDTPGLEDDSAVVAVQQVVAQWERKIAEGRGQKRLVLRLGGCACFCCYVHLLSWSVLDESACLSEFTTLCSALPLGAWHTVHRLISPWHSAHQY